MVIPGRKEVYRLYGKDGKPLVDLMDFHAEDTLLAPSPPLPDQPILVKHPFFDNKRAKVIPSRVVSLLFKVFDGTARQCLKVSITDSRARCYEQLTELRSDHTRPLNPAPYKVSVTESLFDLLKKVWSEEMPISELK
jgi:nicotinate phosphoribosyltransferase